jgi:hypothetical protein
MTPEEQIETYPPFIVEGLKDIREEIKIEEETGKTIPYNPTKITDFIQLIRLIWVISNKEYQERFWVRQEPPMLYADNYMETLETFSGDTRAALKTNKEELIAMTPKQREMLQKLYDMIDFFTEDPEAPGSDYGENDEAIVNDPRWQKISEYSKLVYEELSGDDLSEWEKQRK